MKLLEDSLKLLQEAPDTGYETDICLAQQYMLKSLQNCRITLYRMAMTSQWKPEQKQDQKDQGSATCQELQSIADQNPRES